MLFNAAQGLDESQGLVRGRGLRWGGWWFDRMGPCVGSREGIRVGSSVGEPRNSGVSLSNSSLVNIREDCG
jgi:hypothetical protein